MIKNGISLLCLLGCLLALDASKVLSEVSFPQSEIVIISRSGDHKFIVDIATTPSQRQLGLMFRQHMRPNHGMLFNFGEAKLISMWMKNTLISLDMLFVDSDGTILQIEQKTTPLSLDKISGTLPAMSVIELNAGVTAKLGIFEGDQVIHDIFLEQE